MKLIILQEVALFLRNGRKFFWPPPDCCVDSRNCFTRCYRHLTLTALEMGLAQYIGHRPILRQKTFQYGVVDKLQGSLSYYEAFLRNVHVCDCGFWLHSSYNGIHLVQLLLAIAPTIIDPLMFTGSFGLPGPRFAIVDSGSAFRIFRNSLRLRLTTTSWKTSLIPEILSCR